jgi:hypothetical protein
MSHRHPIDSYHIIDLIFWLVHCRSESISVLNQQMDKHKATKAIMSSRHYRKKKGECLSLQTKESCQAPNVVAKPKTPPKPSQVQLHAEQSNDNSKRSAPAADLVMKSNHPEAEAKDDPPNVVDVDAILSSPTPERTGKTRSERQKREVIKFVSGMYEQ